MEGIVLRSINNIYSVRNEDGNVYSCRIKGKQLAQAKARIESRSDSILEKKEPEDEKIAVNTVNNITRKYMKIISNRIAPFYRCRVYEVKSRFVRSDSIKVFGLVKDVQLFNQVLAFTFESFKKCFDIRLKQDGEYQSFDTHTKHQQYNVRLDSYTWGYTEALVTKLQEQNQSLSECRDLVLTVPKKVDDFIHQSYNVSGRTKRSFNTSSEAYKLFGYMDGRNSGNLHSSIDYSEPTPAAA